MKKCLFYFLSVFMILSCNVTTQNTNVVSVSSKGFSDAPQKQININRISEIESTVPVQVDYIQSAKCCIILQGDSTQFDAVEYTVNGDELKMRLKPGTYENLWLKITVCSPDIEEINTAGSGNLTCTSLHLDHGFSLSSMGSGDVAINEVNCDELDFDLLGSGDLSVEKINANSLELDSKGSGSIYLNNLNVRDETAIDMLGSGDAIINGTTKYINAELNGSGSLKGQLKYEKMDYKKNGSGNISFNE